MDEIVQSLFEAIELDEQHKLNEDFFEVYNKANMNIIPNSTESNRKLII